MVIFKNAPLCVVKRLLNAGANLNFSAKSDVQTADKHLTADVPESLLNAEANLNLSVRTADVQTADVQTADKQTAGVQIADVQTADKQTAVSFGYILDYIVICISA